MKHPLEGMIVHVEWKPQYRNEEPWRRFAVLAVVPPLIRLQGLDDPEMGAVYEGRPIWVPIDTIDHMEERGMHTTDGVNE